MNNVHDMGGLQGFGPIPIERDEPVFHAPWEKRAFALTVAMNYTRQWNIDTSRSLRESLPPVRYLSNTYYQTWLDGLGRLLLKKDLVTEQELSSGKSLGAAKPGVTGPTADTISGILLKGSSSAREAKSPAKFSVGDSVRTLEMHPKTHTRLPRYCRDKQGVITACHGVFVYPDKNAIGPDEPQWMYTVEFDAKTLWGPDSTAASVSLNCWEPYLLKA
jgi:nitrile hydratase subunit beta